MEARIQYLLASLMIASLLLSSALVYKLHQASEQVRESKADAEKWKSVAQKAYMAYLISMSPAEKDGLVHQVFAPKGTRIENGKAYPPLDFCAGGLIQCEWPRQKTSGDSRKE